MENAVLGGFIHCNISKDQLEEMIGQKELAGLDRVLAEKFCFLGNNTLLASLLLTVYFRYSKIYLDIVDEGTMTVPQPAYWHAADKKITIASKYAANSNMLFTMIIFELCNAANYYLSSVTTLIHYVPQILDTPEIFACLMELAEHSSVIQQGKIIKQIVENSASAVKSEIVTVETLDAVHEELLHGELHAIPVKYYQAMFYENFLNYNRSHASIYINAAIKVKKELAEESLPDYQEELAKKLLGIEKLLEQVELDVIDQLLNNSLDANKYLSYQQQLQPIYIELDKNLELEGSSVVLDKISLFVGLQLMSIEEAKSYYDTALEYFGEEFHFIIVMNNSMAHYLQNYQTIEQLSLIEKRVFEIFFTISKECSGSDAAMLHEAMHKHHDDLQQAISDMQQYHENLYFEYELHKCTYNIDVIKQWEESSQSDQIENFQSDEQEQQDNNTSVPKFLLNDKVQLLFNLYSRIKSFAVIPQEHRLFCSYYDKYRSQHDQVNQLTKSNNSVKLLEYQPKSNTQLNLTC